MTLRTAFATSTLSMAVLVAACAGLEEEGAETSSLEEAAAVAAGLPAPPAPPDDPVYRQCLLDALKRRPDCLMRENADPACSALRAAAVRACSAAPPTPPPPPPPPRDGRCVRDAREAYAECVRANPAEKEACDARLEAALVACPPATTPPTPPPPPPVAGSR
jgi:hypothetical protein